MIDHLGMESIAACLKVEGHDVAIIDSGPARLEDDNVLEILCAVNPSLVGFALNYANIQDVLALAVRARHRLPQSNFVAGGHYATFHADQLLMGDAVFDAVVLGEGERPLVALAQTKRTHWIHVPGLTLQHNGNVIRTKVIAPPELNELPYADRSVLAYMCSMPNGCVKVAIEASRGCRHNCNFCSIAACQALAGDVGRRRVRSPKIIAEEIATIIQDWKIKDFWFVDPDFLGGTNDKNRILEIAEAIKSVGHDLSLEIDARADSVERETIRALRSAGLKRAFLGIESFDQATLNSFSKGATVKGNLRAIHILLDEGVRPIIGSIIFHPASTLEQISIEHKYLSNIGYEKTQMLFRLKKYRGSRDAGQILDCEGRGVSSQEDYGWTIKDPHVRLVWKLFDRGRLSIMDAVFIDLTQQFIQGQIDTIEFQKQADKIFSGISACMGLALEVANKCKACNFNKIFNETKGEIDAIVAEIISSSKMESPSQKTRFPSPRRSA